MGGTLAQVGDTNRVRYKPIEFTAQQAVEFLVWFQNDTGFVGSFYYYPNAGSADALTSQWMYSGLHAMATSSLGARGVYVNNMVKSRIGQFLKTSIKATPLGTPARRPFGSGGFTYSPAYTGYSFQLSTTSAMTLTARAASTSCLEQRPVAGRRRDWRHQYSVLLARRQTVTANGAAWLLSGFNVISGNAINAMEAPMRNSLAILTLNLAQ